MGSVRRIEREKKTVDAMIRLYCDKRHNDSAGLCDDCRELMDYALARLDRCVFGESKPTCGKCPIHCYKKDRREQIIEVMRFAGPRMLWTNPFLAIGHLVDGRRKIPPLPAKGKPGEPGQRQPE
ncbi:nitrous oxide-stimulated promoter family protein [Heliobacterium undosum]|uniref:Nitrous oxide-stimulated promoter family protein n=1 Tax=Heliomicrobium undosum TaxID=121734 RepID=A0A845L6M4_9FIRM|nr:nitrous oxide-stimulated promoter family protein [Heliomicrobium undosum]MZP30685.1 nitrous oxide-stimulated promoter family protein [Heliomicrobium undosum]